MGRFQEAVDTYVTSVPEKAGCVLSSADHPSCLLARGGGETFCSSSTRARWFIEAVGEPITAPHEIQSVSAFLALLEAGRKRFQW